MTVTASKLDPGANILPNMKECENGWANFYASFRVVVLKLTEIYITIDLLQFLTCRCSLSAVIMSYNFLFVELMSTFPLSIIIIIIIKKGQQCKAGRE